MSKRSIQRKPNNRLLKNIILICCEGESEKKYVEYVNKKYKNVRNVKIKAKKSNKINQKNLLKQEEIIKGDKVFLMYDLDHTTKDKLLDLRDNKKYDFLYSKPCLEYWYFLHLENNKNKKINDKLTKCLEYKKGKLNNKLKKLLDDNYKTAKEKAEKTKIEDDNFTELYKLEEFFKNLKEKK